MTIRNDATRLRIVTKDERQPRTVVARQGQVLLDADLDQQSRHQFYRIETETVDVLGSPGRLVVPENNNGFKVTADGGPANFNIGDGRGYLAGWLVENAAVCKLTTQPHPRTANGMAADAVTAPAIVGLKALIRHVDPVEDPVLADVALGDAQASGRALVDWQVFPFAVAGAGPASCADATKNADWLKLIAPSTGMLAVSVQTAAPSTDPCSLTPGGGYTRLENLLYRIEVHGGVAKAGFSDVDGQRFGLDQLKLKFSRRNASTLVRVTGITGMEIAVAPPMLDARNWFAPGLYAEIVSIHDDVDQRSAFRLGRLFRITLVTDDHVTLEGVTGDLTAIGIAADGTWFLRLWDAFPDGTGAWTVSAGGGAMDSASIDLGDGLAIKLSGGAAATFRRGDYWTFAARADGSIDWPMSGAAPQLMSPHGPEIRYAPIATVGGTAQAPTYEDCRIQFATLTDRTLVYRGGDSQSVFAPAGSTMVTLSAKLRVAVMRGEIPVAGAAIRWSLFQGAPPCQINGQACTAANAITVATNAAGLAEVDWAIDATQPLALHRVQAAIDPAPAAGGSPPIVFSATFETAAHTAYAPGKCSHLLTVDNVQDALDILCAKIDERSGGCAVTVGEGGQEKSLTTELIDKLIDKMRGRVCICLLPGVHQITDLKANGQGRAVLSIHGCGPATIIQARDDPLTFAEFPSLDIASVTLDGPQRVRILKCNDVRFDSIRSIVPQALPGPLVQFAGCQRVAISHCNLDYAKEQPDMFPVMLLLEDNGAIEIANSEIGGIISFYGMPEDNKPPPPQITPEFERRFTASGAPIQTGAGRVRLQGNRFEYLSIGKNMTEQFVKFASGGTDKIAGALSEAIVTGNSFGLWGGTFISEMLSLSNCTFTGPGTSVALATFVADVASVAGNTGKRISEDYLRVYSKNYDRGDPFKTRAANSIRIIPS